MPAPTIPIAASAVTLAHPASAQTAQAPAGAAASDDTTSSVACVPAKGTRTKPLPSAPAIAPRVLTAYTRATAGPVPGAPAGAAAPSTSGRIVPAHSTGT